ncbi:hypothetical protein YC2023_004766 [Brassica napus]
MATAKHEQIQTKTKATNVCEIKSKDDDVLRKSLLPLNEEDIFENISLVVVKMKSGIIKVVNIPSYKRRRSNEREKVDLYSDPVTGRRVNVRAVTGVSQATFKAIDPRFAVVSSLLRLA